MSGGLIGFQPDFPEQEIISRISKLQQKMGDAGIDAVFLNAEPDLRYFTGFRTLFWQSPTRPWFLIIPAKEDPIAVIPSIGSALMAETPISDIRTWSSPDQNDDGISLLTECLKKYSKIGMMKGRETSLRMPLNGYENLLDNLRHAEFHDVTDIVQSLRHIKSELEIEKQKIICSIASNAFSKIPKLVSAGQPLNEAFRAFKIALLEEGAEEVPYLVGGAGQGGYGDVISPPGSQALEQGDVLMLDTGATYHGYFCDFDRNFAIGRADDIAKRGHDILWQATEAGLNIARSGTSFSDLFHAMNKVLDDHALTSSTGASVGRYGHGLGIELTETPSIIDFDMTVLRPGMTLTLEPSMDLAPGKMMVHEENILITEDEPVLLTTRVERELLVI